MATVTLADLISTSAVHLPSDIDIEWGSTRKYAESMSAKEAIKAPRFVVNNVARYAWEVGASEQSGDKDAYPCLVPPFPLMWMEYDRQPVYQAPEQEPTDTSSWTVQRYGVRVDRFPIENAPAQALLLREQLATESALNDSKWVVMMSMYVQEHGRVEGPVCTEFLWLDQLGRNLRTKASYMALSPPNVHGTTTTGDDIKSTRGAKYFGAFAAFRMALTFLNTRGIKHDERRPSTKANKNWQKKTGQPLLTHKTLVVESVLPSGASRSGTSTEKSHHIRRGHFKDYREGPGLFGKHKILVWVESHIAGDKATGTVEKTYEVRPPRN